MMDFAGALGGAPPGGPPGGPPGPPPGPPDDTQGGQEQYSDSLDALNAADDALHAFIQLDPDNADRAEASKALQIVLRLKATNQQDSQQGGLKSLQRALAGGAGGAGV
jgi:hypothetical protein